MNFMKIYRFFDNFCIWAKQYRLSVVFFVNCQWLRQ